MEVRIPIEFGDKVEHIVHGFEGVVTGMGAYDTGCIQLYVRPLKLDKESGNPVDGLWFDIKKLRKIPKAKRLKLVDHDIRTPIPGGPGNPHPSGDSHPPDSSHG